MGLKRLCTTPKGPKVFSCIPATPDRTGTVTACGGLLGKTPGDAPIPREGTRQRSLTRLGRPGSHRSREAAHLLEAMAEAKAQNQTYMIGHRGLLLTPPFAKSRVVFFTNRYQLSRVSGRHKVFPGTCYPESSGTESGTFCMHGRCTARLLRE